jgi:hypothetical protein
MIEYGNLFCISFYEYEIHHFCNEEKVDSIINAEKKVKENGEIYFFKNDDIFVFSEKTRFLKSAILKSEKFSVASKKIIPTESTLEDVNNVFGRNAKKICNIDVEFVYTFIDFGQEMINQYVEAIFIDVDGKKKKYEKENINMEKSTRKIVTTESLFDTNGIEVKNPVLYLWE